ncbi:MAG TPA: LLM class F420-dependent oxidoreductase [Microthrixaceae bacterium]|nr:LLM class F420-dependent oxidoreductase [Microthrixaceae bacterium]HNI34469.1 LLM class F420-dependent oxidoreductase [Microthrixaceae bacterium]
MVTVPPKRYGMTIPFASVPLVDQREWFEELADLGYTDVWSSEANATDAFTPLALASVWAPSLRLGTAIVPAYTRGPATLAQQVGTMAAAAPGRFVFGIGTSSDVIVEKWNGLAFEEPYRRTRDTVRFLKDALTGAKTDTDATGFSSHGFRLGVTVPDGQVPIVVAALREGMLKMAGREADGAVVNWLSADDAATVSSIVQAASPDGTPREVVARIFVAPTTDRDLVHKFGRLAISAYLNVPVYAAFHEWMGRGEALAPMWEAWKAGDRAAALEAIPDEVVDDLIVWGPPEKCREHVDRYIANGVTTPVLAILPFGIDERQAVRDLAPR